MCAEDNQVNLFFTGGLNDFMIRPAMQQQHLRLRQPHRGQYLFALDPGMFFLQLAQVRWKISFRNRRKIRQEVRRLQHMAQIHLGMKRLGECGRILQRHLRMPAEIGRGQNSFEIDHRQDRDRGNVEYRIATTILQALSYRQSQVRRSCSSFSNPLVIVLLNRRISLLLPVRRGRAHGWLTADPACHFVLQRNRCFRLIRMILMVPVALTVSTPLSADDETALQEMLGYLNFSNGTPDPRFQRHLNQFAAWLAPAEEGPPLLARLLEDRLLKLRGTLPAFQNCEQASAVLSLMFDKLLPAYRQYHADLLFHLAPADFLQPFLLARMFEALLSQGGPWNESERIVPAAVLQLNDFLGQRPIAVLQTGQEMQPYPHERFRPVPLFIRGAGIAHGPYAEVIEGALQILEATPPAMLQQSYFELSQLQELALDVRAYDQGHPVFKRTNYMFGEWDPHLLDSRGRFQRFVVRSIILDALHNWLTQNADTPVEQRVYECSAVLAGTMLMASAVSGSDPHCHDSTISLTTLLPRIARQRDAFYQHLLQHLRGPHGDRLRKEASQVQQPFGRIRQHLNLYLAHVACRQLQRTSLAGVYARMGQPEAARQQAAVIPSVSGRFETEIQLRLTSAHWLIGNGDLPEAARLATEIEDLLHRGIECGALADPWNILGFQGQFPLFAAREDTVGDPRVDILLAVMERIFALYSRVQCEAAARGDESLCDQIRASFQRVAEWWDQFATTSVSDLPPVNGREGSESATQVSNTLLDWYRAGEAAGDIAFWKRHVDDFQSAKSYAIVVDILLSKRDALATMNLLLQWLSQGDQVPLETGPFSFHSLVQQWLEMILQPSDGPEDPRTQPAALLIKFFDALEANAGHYWQVPTVDFGEAGRLSLSGDTASPESDDGDEDVTDAETDLPDSSDEESLYSAAYENVSFRDSAQDGNQSDTVDAGGSAFDSDLDLITGLLEQRWKFLATVNHLWLTAAQSTDWPDEDVHKAAFSRWRQQCESQLHRMAAATRTLAAYTVPKPLGEIEGLAEYDRQQHLRAVMLNLMINAQITGKEAERCFSSKLPDNPKKRGSRLDEISLKFQRALDAGNVGELQALFPALRRELVKYRLLYIPLDRGGRPHRILSVRSLHSMVRDFLTQLPRLGLLRETWLLLRTAYHMERTSPPGGKSITEFDRLLQTALQSSLDSLIRSSSDWDPDQFTDDELVEMIGQITEQYLRLWLKHSSTMRLGTVEALSDSVTWRRLKAFIKKYGGELFHPRLMSLASIRGLIQTGAEEFLEWLAENNDPLHPLRLLEDLDHGLDREEIVFHLNLIFRCIAEKYDRFVEYNTTTTQSDYGEQLYTLLDFLRLETGYERHAWNLTPLVLAHEMLSRHGKVEAASVWYDVLKGKTAPLARVHLQKLRKLERQYAMQLPSITDQLNERFVKPLVLDRILALVEPAMRDAVDRSSGDSFARLKQEIEQYLSTTSGSALDIQPWLQNLDDEVSRVENALVSGESSASQTGKQAPIDPLVLQAELETWSPPDRKRSEDEADEQTEDSDPEIDLEE